MDKYEHIMLVGEGSYGVVMKCRHKEVEQVVAIKKFLETEEDATIRKMALREIRMLRRLKHENLVAIIEVFRYRKRFYLVFEYLDGTILDELERIGGGLGEERSRERLYQILRALSYCHSNQIIHRDVKPENVLVSSNGMVKLCDFGFARLATNTNEPLTDYVATRWYRAPELLVGDQCYGTGVDIWATGCLFAEMLTGDPLFPGDSDIDQLFLIVKMMGKPCPKHQQLMTKNSSLRGIKASSPHQTDSLQRNFPDWPSLSVDILSTCLKMDPGQRSSSDELLRHNYFTHDNFAQIFVPALREKVLMEYNANPLLRKSKAEILYSTDKHEEQRRRKPLSSEPYKWKFHFTSGEPGPTKRKLLHDPYESSTDRSQRSTHRTPKVVPLKTNKEKVTLKQYSIDFQNGNNAAEMYMLEKSLESLARLSQKNEQHIRVESPLKELPLDAKPNTPQQSYNSIAQYVENKGMFSMIGHPVHQNRGDGKLYVKKSPMYPTKTTMSQLSFGGYHKNQFLKKDKQHLLQSSGTSISLTPWFAKKEARKMGENKDGFTLPNLPGAMASPTKSKRKNFPEPSDFHLSDTITPAHRYGKKRKFPETANLNKVSHVHLYK